MKRLICLLPIFFLSGCITFGKDPVPVKMKWPEVPTELLEACPDLKSIDPNTTKLSDVLEVAVDNYRNYHECRLKLDTWIEWYKTQKRIMDSL